MEIRWERYPQVSQSATAKSWLEGLLYRGRSTNTVDTYARGLEDYLSFCAERGLHPNTVTQLDVCAHSREMIVRLNSRWAKKVADESGTGLSFRTINQRLSIVRQYCDYLVVEEVRTSSSVRRDRYRYVGVPRGTNRPQTLFPYTWIPSEDDWLRLSKAANEEPIRNKVMFLIAYTAAVSGKELCLLKTTDIDISRRLICIRPETTCSHRGRVVPYLKAISALLNKYLQDQAKLGFQDGPLFPSSSSHMEGQAISHSTWSRVLARISARAGVPRLSPNTLRHLCIVDLVRADWSTAQIAAFAGYKSRPTLRTLSCNHTGGSGLAKESESKWVQIQGVASNAAKQLE